MSKRPKPIPKEPFYHFVKKKGWIVLNPDSIVQDSEGNLYQLEVRKPKLGESFVLGYRADTLFYKDGRAKIKAMRSYFRNNEQQQWGIYRESNYKYDKEYYEYAVFVPC